MSTKAKCCLKPIVWTGLPISVLRGGYGKLVRVELLHKLHDELKYDSLQALNQGIQRDCDDARAWLAARI